MNKLNSNTEGFTIVELLIATTVFAVVLTGLVYSVLFISDNFTKGSIESQTQSTSRSITQQISQEIQLEGGVVTPVSNTPVPNESYFCVGNTRYTFILNEEQSSSTGPMLSEQSFPNCSAGLTTNPGTISHSLLADNMRLGQLSVSNVTGQTGEYAINIIIGYGSSDYLNGTNGSGPPYNYYCNGGIFTDTYCATSNLSTVVDQRAN